MSSSRARSAASSPRQASTTYAVAPSSAQLTTNWTPTRLPDLLTERGIWWAPDTLVSGGGIIAPVARELHGASAAQANEDVRGIEGRLAAVLADAQANAMSPLHVARDIVAQRLRPNLRDAACPRS